MSDERGAAPDPRRRLAALAEEGAERSRAARERARRVSRWRRMFSTGESSELIRAVAASDPRFLATILLCVLLSMAGLVFLWSDFAALVPVSTETATLAGIGNFALFIGLAVASRWYWGPRRVRELRAWLAAQPYEIVGFISVLEQNPSEEVELEVTIVMAGEGPPEDIASGLLGRADVTLTHFDARSLGGRSRTIRCPSGDSVSTNANVFGWMRLFLREVVEPLHAAHTVARVKFRR